MRFPHVLLLMVLQFVLVLQTRAQPNSAPNQSTAHTAGSAEFQLARATVDGMFDGELEQVSNGSLSEAGRRRVEEAVFELRAKAVASREGEDRFFNGAALLTADKLAVAARSKIADDADANLFQWWSREVSPRDQVTCAMQIADAWGDWEPRVKDSEAKIGALTRKFEWLVRARKKGVGQEVLRTYLVEAKVKVVKDNIHFREFSLPALESKELAISEPLTRTQYVALTTNVPSTANQSGEVAILTRDEAQKILANHTEWRAPREAELRLGLALAYLLDRPLDYKPAWVQKNPGGALEVFRSGRSKDKASLYLLEN